VTSFVALTYLRDFAATPARSLLWIRPTWGRVAAGLAGVATAIGAGLVLLAVLASGSGWSGGYVSEAGVGAQANSYRLGTIALAAALLLLGLSIGRTLPVVGGTLGVAGTLASVSGTVTCSRGCPLPPYESASAADLIHAVASIVAIGCVVLAMLATATIDGVDPALRWASRVTAGAVIPLLATMAVAMLTAGRGPLTAVLERCVLLLVAAWAITAAVRQVAQRSPYLQRTEAVQPRA
jgi:hypothetical protein